MKYLLTRHNTFISRGHIFGLMVLGYLFFIIFPNVSHAAQRQLELGMYGEDVRALQVLLNSDLATQVAPVGSGASGLETTYFGVATEAAVIKFQKKFLSEMLDITGLGSGLGVYGPVTQSFVAHTKTLATMSADTLAAAMTSGLTSDLAVTSAAVRIEGLTDSAVVSGNITVVVNPIGLIDIKKVVFYIDGDRVRTEREAPYSLGSNTVELKLLPFSTNTLKDGQHTLSILAISDSKTIKKQVNFIVKNKITTPAGPVVAPTRAVQNNPALPSGVPVTVSEQAKLCARENSPCLFTGTKQVRYGVGSTFVTKTMTGGTDCSNKIFGDPKRDMIKACYIVDTPVVVIPGTPAIIVPKTEVKPVTPVVVAPVSIASPSPLLVTVPTTGVQPPVIPVIPVVVTPTPPVLPLAPKIVEPAKTVATTNILSNKSVNTTGLGCEILTQSYLESSRVAVHDWKVYNADSVTVNGKRVEAKNGVWTSSYLPFTGKESFTFELVVTKASDTKTCRIITSPILAPCTATLQASKTDKRFINYTVSFPTVSGSAYEVAAYTLQGYLKGYKLTGSGVTPVASTNSLTFSGTLAKAAIDSTQEVQFLTRMAFSPLPTVNILNNSTCVTRYNPAAAAVTPKSSNETAIGSAPAAPKSGTGTSVPNSGSVLGTPSLQNGGITF